MSIVAPLALIVDTDSNHTRALQTLAESAGFQCRVSTDGNLPNHVSPSIVFLCLDNLEVETLKFISDPALNNATEVILMASEDDQVSVRRAISEGATYFFCKPFDRDFLEPLLIDVFEEVTSSLESTDTLDIAALDQFGQLRGSSVPMRKLYRMLRKVAPTDASILLVGESGTGKELAAQTLHQLSDIADAPFVAMNCAAVPKELFESELFGHEKGSFSGAEHQHQGFFERAEGGTLFLDELAEMPIELQAKLLRVLEVGAYRRVGGEKDVSSTVRIVAATNREPDAAIAENLLREDLYYRVAQFPIWLPPLRSRGTDIEGLTQYFIDALNEKNGSTISINAAALEVLRKHTWPGNVRELRSAIENAFIMADTEITPKELPELDVAKKEDELTIAVGESVEDAEKKLIVATLDANGGDKQAAADMLGLSLRTLYSRLSDYEEEVSEEDNM
ncbi:MAG: two-component system response regulator AtoC [Candidatus Azotimanducaceae bacterium]|jgi:two-component system response regulator AtoC